MYEAVEGAIALIVRQPDARAGGLSRQLRGENRGDRQAERARQARHSCTTPAVGGDRLDQGLLLRARVRFGMEELLNAARNGR